MDDVGQIIHFYKGKTVLVTGHTGFKGSWLSKILIMAGANVVGYSLEPPTEPNLFSILNLSENMTSIIGDIRDFDRLKAVFDKYKPEIVFHLAAQPIVRDSYKEPRYTYDVNVLGTVNVCECIRISKCVKSFLNVTTDKVYENNDENNHAFVEEEKLDGFDPYSNSKSCSELVTHSYWNSFLKEQNVAVSTARAGNVIGGGDFANDRIIPDCFRSIKEGKTLKMRNPRSTRPYQHVLDPILCYLLIVKKQFENIDYCDAYNIGPDIKDILKTEKLVELFFRHFPMSSFDFDVNNNGPHEANYLSLSNKKIKSSLGWNSIMSIGEAIDATAEWYKSYLNSEDMRFYTEEQIKKYLGI